MKKSTQINAAAKAEEARLRAAAHERVWGGTLKMEKLTPASPLTPEEIAAIQKAHGSDDTKA